MAGNTLQRLEESALEKAVRAGRPEQWNIEDEDKHVSVLIVPLPGADQAIVHSALIRYSPILINTKHASYAKNMEELNEIVLTTNLMRFIDEPHLAFLWLWLFEKDVLVREAQRVVGTATVNVNPWRVALADGIDDSVKRRLALVHKLPFQKRSLKSTEDTIADDREDELTYGTLPQRADAITLFEQQAEDLLHAIQETQEELGLE